MRAFMRVGALPALLALVAACGDEFSPNASTTSGAGGGSGGANTGSSGQGGHAGAGDGTCPTNLAGPELVKFTPPSGGAYCIDKSEVTVGQYKEWINTGPTPSGEDGMCSWKSSFNNPSSTGDANLPIANVDWCDAYSYCRGVGKRLCGWIGGGPTPFDSFGDPEISQWHSVCTEGGLRNYPYGPDYIAKHCVDWDYNNVNGLDDGDVAVPVISVFTCSPGLLAVFDLGGNIAEWENSCEANAGAGDTCRIRGGSFQEGEAGTRCSAAGTRQRSVTSDDVGFRCCLDL